FPKAHPLSFPNVFIGNPGQFFTSMIKRGYHYKPKYRHTPSGRQGRVGDPYETKYRYAPSGRRWVVCIILKCSIFAQVMRNLLPFMLSL
ncbi:MAG: hypothetical protein PHQ76_05800, partial [Caldisericia bacterium]|nr:hypothetical protein [Caldisericia bacterium]